MLLIPDAHVDRAVHVIDTSNAATLLEEAINLKPQGQRRQLPLRTWLIGCYLAIQHAASFKTTTTYEVLTRGISIAKQHELGVRFANNAGETGVISKSRLDYITRTLPKRLAYTTASVRQWHLDIDQAEMDRRRSLVEQAVANIVAASLVQPGGSWYALDGTGTWSWGKAKYSLVDDADVRTGEDVVDHPGTDARVRDEVADNVQLPTGDTVLPTAPTRRNREVTGNYDPDAAIGTKTSKSGKRESYYGFVVDAAIRIAPPGAPKQPVLVERLVVSPASTDVVAPTFQLLDDLLTTPGGVTDIVVDRHYSYKKVDRWADELRARDITQHFDLRADEQGFKDINGMRLAAGWMHCPATPDDLGKIPHPGPGASKTDMEAFQDLISQRSSWALDRLEAINAAGRTRWLCPAMAGKRGCPLRAGTVEVARREGLPIVDNPPDAATAPTCCTNAGGTVADRSDPMRKHQQRYYWGSPEWQAVYDLRTYVEGLFGSLKNPDTEGVRRGFTKYVGLPMVSLGLALAAAVCNVRHQRNFWSDDADRPDHPLLADDPTFHGWAALTEDQAAAEDERHRGDAAGDAEAA